MALNAVSLYWLPTRDLCFFLISHTILFQHILTLTLLILAIFERFTIDLWLYIQILSPWWLINNHFLLKFNKFLFFEDFFRELKSRGAQPIFILFFYMKIPIYVNNNNVLCLLISGEDKNVKVFLCSPVQVALTVFFQTNCATLKVRIKKVIL